MTIKPMSPEVQFLAYKSPVWPGRTSRDPPEEAISLIVFVINTSSIHNEIKIEEGHQFFPTWGPSAAGDGMKTREERRSFTAGALFLETCDHQLCKPADGITQISSLLGGEGDGSDRNGSRLAVLGHPARCKPEKGGQPTNQASGSGLGDFSAPILSLHILPCRSRSPVPRLSICWAFGWDEAADGLAAYLSLAHWFISPAFHLGVLGREAIQPTSSSLLPSYQHSQ
ncbi:hypothetical protein PGT21_019843 [Puccinia graminis f. sp. tritici]|uniref:Uncharacterized protein n=1 Tax=Puccinia graminis f. sp. tritici TaxID=56615 RepID=A0A5B0RWB4_PUCGR|nr:hypothetical protein PGT21_019843 [Puccinia graminis f. sp. tritici]KAA1130291.1 hypothetical protein PGTUg99_011069 [Puccinia graminis f. sp. tritici]